ncbi:penicillin acylase [Xanthomonas translucens pv. arrhenatheri]|uniref:Penicillin amidase n=1 Tax=Xanthomonas graminis pv. arrhenatheri LMG 727 TaxID=1195923 RepID=A0A0K2ZKM9_9XANT|nr:penicillin acylase family protein [Xanthomonas translucens]OAX65773.1 penicillin acylase [Xanthomonas translucens pv. arrhenatheri]UKE78957.1 penicillin acylase family protein [Xanthomonas translucens pv. arrhenatheri]CTP84829.1 penicillin amidase precursor [Xanthomonas translucens pv. arrhenatheri LMG 727]
MTQRKKRWLIPLLLSLSLSAALPLCAQAADLPKGGQAVLDGQAPVPGLSAPATISRDALGVVTIDAANETDAMRALGYVHAQERYFEMDLLRRFAAGELAGLLGPSQLAADQQHRVHRMRARAQAQLGGFAGERMAQLQAYTDGVNRGLHDLKLPPWAYLLLQQTPRDWQAVDSELAGDALYFDLQDDQDLRELALARIQPVLPPALLALLRHDGSSWDAPLQGPPRGDAVLPGPAQVNLRTLPAPGIDTTTAVAATTVPERGAPGSNNWAVGGRLTDDGRAILANDMHMNLGVPNIWFRARLRYADPKAPGGRVDVTGFTLPGLPAVVVGSNRHVAWGFTNGYADTADWYRVTPCTGGSNGGCEPVTTHLETIDVAGATPVSLRVDDTRYGPILHRNADGSALALRWVAQLPGALNLGLIDLARAGNLDAALASAERIAVPAQNLMLADSAGHIAWRVLGPLPERSRHCPASELVHDTDNTGGAHGCLPWGISTGLSPRQVDPVDGRLWTANARTVDGPALNKLGDGGYALGARAHQIHDDLLARERFGERDLLGIQLDDRAVFLQRWWQLLQREGARSDTQHPALQALATAATTWNGQASTDSVSYRIVRSWRRAVESRIADGLTASAQVALGKDYLAPSLPQLEGVAWPLLQQRPMNLLPRRYASWQALLEDAAADVRDTLAKQGPLAQRTWGEQNTAAICHPLAAALPTALQSLLCMPADQLPGDSEMPRVQNPSFGASERMVVSPGHEEQGIVHMPGGQSGNPYSPFWGAGHEDWVQGKPTPFLPGATTHTLQLQPSG